MPALSRRRAPKLLRVVGGKPYATQEDHVDQLPTPPATDSTRSSINTSSPMLEEDINREPESSDDESAAPRASTSATGFQLPARIDDAHDQSPPTFKQPSSSARESIGSKRSNSSDSSGSDHDTMLFGPQRKRRKNPGFVNIHAPPRKEKGYGRKQKQQSSSQTSSKGPAFKQLRKENPKPKEDTPLKPVFQLAKEVDIFTFGQGGSDREFRTREDMGDRDPKCSGSLSPALSSFSSAPGSGEAVELDGLDLSEPTPHDPKNECAICGEQVDSLLREDFENQFTNGKSISNYKWRQRFCRWHKEQDAKALQQRRSYPEIEWDRLERRMRTHHAHLKAVISCKKPSYYRHQLRENVRSGSKTMKQMLDGDGAKRGASVGYYGPRGERLMTEHIITHLSDKIREQSSKDKLVAAAGVSGGVSGFVQAVLVPELAQELIMEDMKVSTERAREIVVESAELGELLHPDVDDKVTEIADV